METIFGVPKAFVEDCVGDEELENSLDLLISECANTIVACQKVKRAYQLQRPDTIKFEIGRLKSQVARQLAAVAILAHFQGIKEEDIPLEITKFWVQKTRKRTPMKDTTALQYQREYMQIPTEDGSDG